MSNPSPPSSSRRRDSLHTYQPRHATRGWLAALAVAATIVAALSLPTMLASEVTPLGAAGDPGLAAPARGTLADDHAHAGDASEAAARTGQVAATDAALASIVPAVPREHFLLRVTDATTGAGVPAAEVVANCNASRPPTAQEQRQRERLGDPFERLRRSGQTATTDAHGYAVLRGNSWMEVLARQGERHGSANFDLEEVGPSGFELRIRPHELVTARVTDGNRRPLANVPLGLLVTYPYQSSASGERLVHAIGHTDDGGALTFRLQQFLREQGEPMRLEVFVRAPGLTSIRSEIKADRTPATMVLSAYGEVRVAVIEGPGRPLADEPTWNVSIANNGDISPALEFTENEARLSEVGIGGEVVFPYVGLDLQFDSRAWVHGLSPDAAFAGPTRHGQRVTHTFALATLPQATVRARIVDGAGQPLAWRQVQVVTEHDDSRAGATTDEQGRVRIRVRPDDEQAITMRLRVSDHDRFLGISAPMVVAVGCETDLGEVRVAPGDAVATGVLVEERPRPAGLTFFVDEWRDDEWQWAPDLPAAIADDNTFAITSTKPTIPQRMRLRVAAPGCEWIAPIEFCMGQSLRVVLRQGVALRIRVLLPTELLRTAECGGMYFYADNDAGHSPTFHGRVVDGEWVVESHGFSPGRYSFYIEGPGVVALARLENVQLDHGAAVDPRLCPWDLRDQVQVLEVRPVTADGSPTKAGFTAYARVGQGEWLWCGGDGPDSECVLPRQPVDLVVCFADGGFVRKTGVMGTVEVTVPVSTQVQVQLTGLPRLADNAPIHCDLQPNGPSWQQRDLPEEANPDWESEWDVATSTVTIRLFEPTPAILRILRSDDDSKVLASLPCTLSPASSKVTVPITDEAKRALAPWLAKDK